MPLPGCCDPFLLLLYDTVRDTKLLLAELQAACTASNVSATKLTIRTLHAHITLQPTHHHKPLPVPTPALNALHSLRYLYRRWLQVRVARGRSLLVPRLLQNPLWHSTAPSRQRRLGPTKERAVP